MRGVVNILENATGVTDLLKSGASSVFEIEADQGAKTPYVVISETSANPLNTMSGASSQDETHTIVLCVSDRHRTSNGVSGADEVADAVLSALEATDGVYDTEDVREIELEDRDTFIENSPDHRKIVVELSFMVAKIK